MTMIGTNLLGLQKACYYDFPGTMKQLKAIGFHSVETCILPSDRVETPPDLLERMSEQEFMEMTGGIWQYQDASEKISYIRELELNVISAHIMVGIQPDEKMLHDLLPLLISYAAENSIHYYVLSLMAGRSELKNYHPVLREMSRELSRSGAKLLYHNHEMECEDGAAALKELLDACPELGLELDVGWAQFAGYAPEKLIEQTADRIRLLHFKDICPGACAANRASCFTAIGEGSIDLKTILSAAGSCPLDEDGFIIDQDSSNGDILLDLQTGLQNIRNSICTE